MEAAVEPVLKKRTAEEVMWLAVNCFSWKKNVDNARLLSYVDSDEL